MKGADTINHGVLQTFPLLLTAVFLQIREHDVLSNSANLQLVQIGEQGGGLAKLTYQFPLFSLSAHLTRKLTHFSAQTGAIPDLATGLSLAVPWQPVEARRDQSVRGG